jgi:flagellar hook-associated protein 2
MDGLTGIASGVDTSAIVDKLMELERLPRTRLDYRKAALTAQRTDLSTLQTKLIALRTAAAGLRDVGTWADKQTVESSDARVVAERVAGAGPGGYDVQVLSLARAEQRSYAYAPPAAETTLTLGSTTVTLAAGTSLADAAKQINQTAGAPVYAAEVGGRLVLSARTTGTGSAFTATGAPLSDEQVTAGVNATYTVNGGAVQSSQTNVVTDAIPGLKLTFKGTTASAASITVGAPGVDKDAVKAKVKAFVDAYNDLLKTTRGFVDETRPKRVTDATTAAQGALWGDSGLATMLSRLRTATMNVVSGMGATMDEMRELGVSTGAATGGLSTTDSKTGLLVLDEDKLAKALTDDPLGARKLLGGVSGTDGFAQRIEGLLKTYVGSTGSINARITQGDEALQALQKQMTAEDARLASKQARLKAQFAAMESALSTAQSQQAWLAGQIAKLG